MSGGSEHVANGASDATEVPEVPKRESDPVLVDINRRIEEAFDIFDHENNKTVDVREIGTIIRSLGCYPSESDLRDMIQVKHNNNFINFL